MAEVDIASIAKAIARLQTNYSNLAQSWYDMFYNPAAMDVQLEFYDNEGVAHTYIIPNRAKDQKYIKNGQGSPNGTIIADVGTIYQDIEIGMLYLKVADSGLASGWVQVVSASDLNNYIIHGTGEPEGVVYAGIGTIYINTDTSFMYMKRTTSGNTGWERIDSYPSALIRETFDLVRNKFKPNLYDVYIDGTCILTEVDGTFLKLDGACETESLLSVFFNGVMLAPSEYLLKNDLKTVMFKEPITFPQSEDSFRVVIQYFVDIHICDSSVYEEIVYLDKDARKFLYGDIDEVKDPYKDVLPWDELPEEWQHGVYYYWTQVKDKHAEIEEAIASIDQEGEKIKLDLRKFAYGDYIPTEEELKKGIYGVLKEYATQLQTDWNNKYEEMQSLYAEAVVISKTTKEYAAECREWYDKNYDLSVKMQADKDFIEREYEKGNITKHDEPYTNLEGKSDWYDHLQSQITVNKEDIEDRVVTLNTNLTQTINTKETEMYDYVDNRTTQLSNTISAHKTILDSTVQAVNSVRNDFNNADLANFRNEISTFYNQSNMPITKNGLFTLGQNIILIDNTNVEVILNKESTYYSVDVGAVMAHEDADGNVMGDATFLFTIKCDDETSQMIDYQYKPINANIVTVARLFIKNDTAYKPTIDWSPNNIIWLDGELKTEKNKNYLIELVSYDFMETWYAKAFITQPEIAQDDAVVTVSITCPSITDISGFANKDVEVYYTLADTNNVYAGIGRFDITSKVLTMPLNINRKYEGELISNIAVRTTDMEIFNKYFSEDDPIIVEDGKSVNISCNELNEVEYTYKVKFRATGIEQYMNEKGLTSLEVPAKVMFLDDSHIKDIGVYRGTVPTKSDLPSNPAEYDMYLVQDEDTRYMWTEDEWKKQTVEEVERKIQEFAVVYEKTTEYTFSNTDRTQCGAIVTFGNEVLKGTGASEATGETHNSLKRIKARYSGYTEGKCFSTSEDTFYIDIPTIMDGHVSIDLTYTEQEW